MAPSSVKSAERVLAVLDLLARSVRPVPTMTISRDCAIPKSSTHHLLNVMRDRRFVSYYDEERAWGLGVAAFEIGSAYMRSAPLQRMGRHLLVELTAETGDTSHLAVLHGSEVLYIDKEEPITSSARLVTEVGVRLPAHITAVGRAILAQLPEAQVRALYGEQPLVLRADSGPADIGALLGDLDEIRAAGYAFDDEMVSPGISCLAAPVMSHEGVPVAAIGVTFVSAQRDAAARERTTELVCGFAQRLSSNIGHVEGAGTEPVSAG
uniref:Unannotated protein n=1 Tax=freshwater metagenome TaxID=449393 RepID=A0A6J5Z5H7_9ZZZZ